MLIFSFHACQGDAGLKTGAHFPIKFYLPCCLHQLSPLPSLFCSYSLLSSPLLSSPLLSSPLLSSPLLSSPLLSSPLLSSPLLSSPLLSQSLLISFPPPQPSLYSMYLFTLPATSSTHWACVRCSLWIMQVFNTSSNAAGFQGRFSGRSLPGPFHSTNGRFHIRFTTDPLQQFKGWSATFSYGQYLCVLFWRQHTMAQHTMTFAG